MTAGLFLWALQRILLGDRGGVRDQGGRGFADLRGHETAAIAPLMGLAILIGLLPAWLLDVIEPAAQTVVALLTPWL